MIRWITPTLGTSPWTPEIDRPEHSVVDVRRLLDRQGNSQAEIADLVSQVEAKLGAGRKVVVCCDYGMSRSNAIAAAALARIEGIDYSVALRRIIDATGEQQMRLGLVNDVRATVEPGAASKFRSAPDGRVLVTGAEELVGKALLSALPSGIRLEREKEVLSSPILLYDSVVSSGVRCLVHAAHTVGAKTNREAGRSISVLRNLLEVCSAARVRLVFVSGYQVFSGYRTSLLHATETLPPFPSDVIGEGLYLCERLIELHTKRDRLDSLIVRPCVLFGEEDQRRGFLNTFVQRALRGEDIAVHRYLDGSPLVELLHVRDFAAGVRTAIRRSLAGIVHFGSGSGVDTLTLATRICSLSQTQARVRQVEVSRKLTNVILDSSLARSTLGWEPTVSLDDGLSSLLRRFPSAQAKPLCRY